MNRSESIANLGKSLAKAQAVLSGVKPDSKNPHFKSDYASLAAVNKVVLPPLSSNGIAVIQGVSNQDNRVGVSTTFIHGDSGEWWTEELFLPVVKADPQGFGSAITYGRRYLLMAMAGVALDDDDDGNEASGQKQSSQPKAVMSAPVKSEDEKELLAIKDGSLKTLHAVGTKAYGAEWEAKRHSLVASITKGRTNSSAELMEDEAHELIAGISKKLQSQALDKAA